MNAKVAALACSLVVVPQMGRSDVYYFSGNGASNERGFLISDPANWENLAEITPTTEILGLRNSATKKCVLSLDDDLSIKRWSVECVDNQDMVFDFSPYALNASGTCSGASRSGNRLLLKSGTLKCGTLNVPHSGAMRDNAFVAQGLSSSVAVGTFGMAKGTNNTFCICESASFVNYKDSPQVLNLFNDAACLSYRNVFCVSNATVRNYKTFCLAGGLENTVRFENVTFQDASESVCVPFFEFSGGRSNALEIANQRIRHTGVNGASPIGMKSTSFGRVVLSRQSEIVITNNASVGFFGADTDRCSIEITDGSSLMHTNWNQQVQVGKDEATAIGNFVRVSGTGSKLGYSGGLIVGKHGAPCSGLLIEAGGTVARVKGPGGGNGNTFIGQGASQENWVRVTGSGSMFSPYAVTIGCGDSADSQGRFSGDFNSFVVTDGATANLVALQVGFFNAEKVGSQQTTATSNRVEVLNGATYAGQGVDYAGCHNFLIVSNASMTLTKDLNMPRTDVFAEAHARDMHVVLGGASVQIAAEGKMTFDRNTDFTLTVPKVGMMQPLLKAKGDITFAHCGSLVVDWPKDRDEPVILAQSQGTLSIDDVTLASMQSGLSPDLKLKVTGQSIELRKRRGILMIVR